MGPPEVKSVAEHWDLLFWLLAVVVGVALAELRYAFHNMCKSQKRFMELHNKCQRELPEKFLALGTYKEEKAELKEDRKNRWDKHFWPHTHRDDGSVKVPNPIPD